MSDPSLRDIQHQMKTAIRRAEHGTPADVELPFLNPQRDVPGTERLAVYGGGYLARTRQALSEVFPAVQQVLGKRMFGELAHDYSRAHASADYNLSLVGRHLPEFLTTWPRTASLPFLPDVARLEWAVAEAFHAFEQPPLEASQFTDVSLEGWDRARVTFQPSVRLVASAWPILDLWNVRHQPRKEIDVDLVNRPQRVLVFRHDFTVRGELLDARQHALLEGLLAGHTLGAVCGTLEHGAEGHPLPVTAWFAHWMQDRLITDCEIASSREAH